MANSVGMTGICLHALPAREEAVLKRVISFSSAQGRNYVLSPPEQANLLVVSDDTTVDLAQMNPDGCLIIRIADAGNAQMYDVLMQRPLLVTKVMRTLDEAKAMLSVEEATASPTESTAVAPTTGSAPAPSSSQTSMMPPVETPAIKPIESTQSPLVSQSVESAAPSPKPAMSLYAQVLGTGATQATAEPSSPSEQSPPSQAVEQQTQTVDSGPAEPHLEQQQTSADPVQHDDVQDSGVASVVTDNTIEHDTPPAVTETADPQGDANHLALVVDDSAAIRKQLELELRAAGIAAEFAETGEEALEKVAAKRYDLIFLDIIMPGIDGYETCRQMRLRPELKKTPVIMLSAKTSPLDEVQGVIAGASTYLTKPVKSEQLQQTLKRVSMWLDNFQVSV